MTPKKRRYDEDRDEGEDWGFFDDPFWSFDREFEEIRKKMDSMLRGAFSGRWTSGGEERPFVYGFSMRVGPDGKPHVEEFGNTRPWTRSGAVEPLTDVIDEGDYLTITFELPGVSKEDIETDLTEDSLTVSAELPNRKYYKRLSLPAEVDPETAKATFNNGILSVRVKKKEGAKGKRLKIE